MPSNRDLRADLLKPDDNIKFCLHHFCSNRLVCSPFFNFFTNLNKLVAYETREPHVLQHEINENPDFSDWDRFASAEYYRLSMEEEKQNQEEVFDS